MEKDELFENLFIMDMANNHQGSVKHGLGIIRAIAEKSKKHNIKAAIKFQYRQLDTFIHPNFKEKKDIKHIPRFMETSLIPEEFKIMVDEAKKQGLITICTPFDEDSVDIITKHGIDIIKVASCSAQDWPLLQEIANTKKPVICSTGGLTIKQVDKIVSFFTHRNVNFALMHCVALYPTKNEDLNLGRIDFLIKRYPFLKIGFSTHEEPDNLDAVKMAIAQGAKILERHVGLITDKIKLNAYSSTPEQIEKWFLAAKIAWASCQWEKNEIKEVEKESLDSLKRGVYVKKPVKKGEALTRDKVFFAMPLQNNQLPSEKFREGLSNFTGEMRGPLIANKDYQVNELVEDRELFDTDSMIFETIHEMKGILYGGRIAIGKEFKVELSHQYGVEKFREYGAMIIDVINREYCKKLLIQVPGQVHPMHYHKVKEETFQVLHGDLIIEYGNETKVLNPGDKLVIERGVPHSFTTKNGVIVEEVSTTHVKDDSYYLDKNVPKDTRIRKTKFELW